MKNLDLNQMVQIEGGACSAGMWSAGAMVASTLFLAAAIASGPVGWAAYGAFAFGHGYGLANAIVNC